MDACAILSPVSEFYQPIDEDDAPHALAMALAGNAIQDLITAADLLQKAILSGEPPEDLTKLREAGIAYAESYLDLMAQAATQTLAQEP